MTGDHHFREAERLLTVVRKVETSEFRVELLTEAQVHATLALAAAKAIGLNLAGYGGERGAA